ncbi:hypothetical protein OQA88_4094 [Cercophora sp. LCS_1]
MARMEELPTEISIVTLNCWGLKCISKLRHERLSEIGRQLAIAEPQPHIVALQECWTQEDYKSIRRETRFILPYGKFYHSGAFGGGLAILSRWPIEESSMYQYPLNGRPTAFWRGDWFVGKGVACARIRYGPDLKHIIETHAPYEHGPNDSYLCHRLAQSWEISKLLRGASERGHLVLGLGDFNMVPLSLEHRIITAHSPVRDIWRILHPESSVGPADHPAEKARRRPIPTAEFNIVENGAASDGPYNTWRWPKQQQKLLGPGKPEVIVPPDTIGKSPIPNLSTAPANSPPQTTAASASTTSLPILETLVPEPLRLPKLPTPRPDSETIAVSDAVRDADADADPNHDARTMSTHVPTNALQNGTFLHITSRPSPTTSEDFTHSPSAVKKFDAQLLAGAGSDTSLALPGTVYDEILGVIHKYVRRERTQQTWRGRHFFASVAVSIACLVGIWFNPYSYVSFILILVSSLGLVAGTIDGLLALLFFKSELRALKEFEWEIMNAKAAVSGGVEPAHDDVEDADRAW